MSMKTGLAIILILGLTQCKQPDTINLAGEWNYRLDENNLGLSEQWFARKLENRLLLPGSLRDNGIGNIPTLETQWTGSIYDSTWFFNPAMAKYRQKDSLKFPFWLTPETRYVGAAWYQKEISIPEKWGDKTLALFLERPHWQTRVWIDTMFLGNRNSLSVPHLFSIEPGKIKPGKHLLTIRVDNAIRDIDPGINSHSISDHTQGNWNGVVGTISLRAISESHITQVKIIPDLSSASVEAKIDINPVDGLKGLKVSISIEGINHSHALDPLTFEFGDTGDELKVSIAMGKDVRLWSEFSPNLYQMTLTLEDEKGILDKRKEIFGMREFTTNEKHFAINGTPIFLRGTTDCSVFPLTGYPPANEEDWARIFRICKSYGLNHMRFHSYCPPEAAFLAADKAGIYLQVEGPSWAKYSVTLGDGKPLDLYLMEETKRIIDTYGNHPSFCMMAYGNEPSGNYVPYLENWVDVFKKYDPQRVFTGASTGRSWAIIENSDFIVRSPPRGLEWRNRQPESLFDYRDKTENQQRPYITFEMGQWCVFPNFKEIQKYTGPLKARNFELFREDLSDKHMGDQADDFLMASGKLQVSCYKQEIEATLRTPGLAGFQLLSLNDFSGQGTALVGVLDAFWDEKGYVSAEEFRRFCNTVVPLVRLPKYTFFNSETLRAGVEVANFSGITMKNTETRWKLIDKESAIVDSGSFDTKDIPQGNCHELGIISIPLDFIQSAGKFTLVVEVGNYSNQWNIWVYPKTSVRMEFADLHVCNSLDDEASTVLKNGGKVLLLAAGNVENGKELVQYLTPAFWNTSWFRMRPPHTTGILIQDSLSVFNDFPTDYYGDLQWWELANRQQVMNLEKFPPGFKAIIQPIDTWFLNRPLAMLFEARVDNGSLMVCSIDLKAPDQNRPVAQQLLLSIVNYMQSDAFVPVEELGSEIIRELFEKKEREVWNSYVKANP